MLHQESKRLLAYLETTSLLESYRYSIYESGKGSIPDEIDRELCGAQGIPHLCREICVPSLSSAVENAMSSGKPAFFRCPLGLFSFVIPVSVDSCLVCGGVRENLFDLYFRESEEFEFLKGKKKAHPYEILEQLEKLPVTTEKEARETMLKVERLIASFYAEERMPPVDSADALPGSITKVAESIENSETLKSAIALYIETLGIMFDIPAIAIVLKDENSDLFIMESCWGAFSDASYLSADMLPFKEKEFATATLSKEEVTSLFPKSEMNSAVCIPFANENELFGMATLFNASLTDNDTNLAGLLTGKLVKKIEQNILDRESRRSQRGMRLLEMFRTLALSESQKELLRLITEMAAELVDAASGSLMLLDREGKVLRVASAMGINPVLAQNLYTRVGEGIAGRVAASGAPLLVMDIEKELQMARPNRTRFATRSCISLPLLFKGETIGVLNLADKNSSAPFSQADLDVLTAFLDQATIILERSTILKKAKQSIITDPLTGLYNLRFIKKRLNEELSRSIRHNLQMTLIIASLDHSAAGHNAAERAAGDRLVKEIARTLSSSLREIDLIGRIGKKEFCVILPSTSMKESLHVAGRIMGAQNEREISTSIGIASYPDNGASSGELINAAKAALLQAETEGGNRIRCSMTDRVIKVDATQSKRLAAESR